MEEAIREFLAHLEHERGASHNTLQAYRADLRQIARLLSDRLGRAPAVSDLTVDALTGYLGWLQKQEYRPATVARKVAATRAFLDYVGRRLDATARAGLEVLRLPPAPRIAQRILDRAEVAALLAAPTGTSPRSLRDAAILTLLYATGLRASEVILLKVEDIDLARALVFRRGLNESEDQALPLGRAVEPMQSYLHDGRPGLTRDPRESALFLNQRGRALSRQGLWLIIRRQAAAAGLAAEISPHTLRRTLARHLLEQGQSRRQVQDLMGLHSPNALGKTDAT